MSQLIVHPATVVDSIPMTRRITEIMQEKGKYYSVTAMAARIGIHRETYRNMLKGEREIYTFELEKIAQDLKINVDRLTQEDYRKESEELRSLFTSRKNPERFLVLAEQINSVSLGCTERCIALSYLGWAYFELKQFHQAHSIWLLAYELAEKIHEKYGENNRKYTALMNLMLTNIEIKDFAKALEISEQVETVIGDDPILKAELLYTRAKVRESQGDFMDARKLSYEALEHCKKTDYSEMIGRAYVNVAHFQYLLRDYTNAVEMLEMATEYFSNNIRSKLIAQKELVKSLLKLEQKDRAIEIIHTALQLAQEQGVTVIEGKLRILLSRATEEPDHAAELIDADQYDNTIRYLACRFLIGHYKKSGDALRFMYYHGIAEKLKQTTISDILDEKEM